MFDINCYNSISKNRKYVADETHPSAHSSGLLSVTSHPPKSLRNRNGLVSRMLAVDVARAASMSRISSPACGVVTLCGAKRAAGARADLVFETKDGIAQALVARDR
jgi:hypothetical protein